MEEHYASPPYTGFRENVHETKGKDKVQKVGKTLLKVLTL